MKLKLQRVLETLEECSKEDADWEIAEPLENAIENVNEALHALVARERAKKEE